MLREINDDRIRVYIDEAGRRQGEYIKWYDNGQLEIQSFYVDDQLHSEYKEWLDDGRVWVNCLFKNGQYHGEYRCYFYSDKHLKHCFYVDGKRVLFNEIPYPSTPEDRMYFMLKYNIPLLPVENKC